MSKVVIGGCLGHSDLEVAEFQIVDDKRKLPAKLWSWI